MKNIVFDLGGVLFARDKRKCDPEIIEFFSFLRAPKMPRFWEEYDRGTSTLGEVTDTLVGMTGRSRETCAAVLQRAIDLQEPVAPTEELVRDLKEAGYRLYVLSNMSREFIDYLRRFPVYGLFDGEVVSCEELCVKPERGSMRSCSTVTDSSLPRRSSSTTARPTSTRPGSWVSGASSSMPTTRPLPARPSGRCCSDGLPPRDLPVRSVAACSSGRGPMALGFIRQAAAVCCASFWPGFLAFFCRPAYSKQKGRPITRAAFPFCSAGSAT